MCSVHAPQVMLRGRNQAERLPCLQAERKKEKAEAARQANIERIFTEGEGGGDNSE